MADNPSFTPIGGLRRSAILRLWDGAAPDTRSAENTFLFC
jgi:hypothetical protein